MLVRHRTLLVSVLFSAAASQDRCLAGLSIPCKKSGCPQYSRCLRPAPVSKQCAFHRDTAREDCRSSKGCAALSCPRRRTGGARRRPHSRPTFGDVEGKLHRRRRRRGRSLRPQWRRRAPTVPQGALGGAAAEAVILPRMSRTFAIWRRGRGRGRPWPTSPPPTCRRSSC